MKIIAGLLCLVPFMAVSQEQGSCCAVPASGPAGFAAFASDPGFRVSHEEPLPFTFVSEKGSWISFKTQNGPDAKAFEVKSDKPTRNVLFVFHEWWGLNDYIRQEAVRIQKTLGNVTVIALDLYDGKVATTREEAGNLTSGMKDERGRAIIDGALAYVGHDARIFTIGWCFGGGWSLQAALEAGKQGTACVMYYGMPEMNPERLRMLHAPVLGIFAKQDGWINDKVVREFEKKMTDAHKSLTVRWYDAVHAFANPSNPKYDKKATQDAWTHVVSFFRSHLE